MLERLEGLEGSDRALEQQSQAKLGKGEWYRALGELRFDN